MSVLVAFLILVTVFQVGILALCYLHRQDPLLALPREKRAALLIAMLQTRNAVRGIGLFADAMLRKQYGTLTIAQTEFLHQILTSATQAKRTLDDCTDHGGPLAQGTEEAGGEQQRIARERTFRPPDHSILSHLERRESGRMPKKES